MSDKDENEITTQDPVPEQDIPKKKKKRPRKKAPVEKTEEVTHTSEQPDQTQEQSSEQTPDQDMLDELGVNVNFQFLMTIRDILINVSPRVNWNANELLPVGMIIRDLNSIATNVNEQLSQGKKKNEEEDEEEEDDVDETSEGIN